MNASRRHFFRTTAALGAAATLPGLRHLAHPLSLGLAGIGALSAMSAQKALAQSSDYRAIVCLFMAGGNDSHNWVVPTASTEYAGYAAARTDLAWPQAQLLDIGQGAQAAGRSFGMPQELQALRAWYHSGHAAIVANVGPLERPLTLAEYNAGVGRPAKLFSHNDQQSTWQSLQTEGARSGWGGRMGDALAAANDKPVFTAISATGNAVFLSGNAVTQYQVGVDGPVAINALANGWTAGSSTVNAVMRRRLGETGSGTLEAEYDNVLKRAVEANTQLKAALDTGPVPALPTTVLPLGAGTTTLDQLNLAKQLRIVARIIQAAPALGLRRQVFMVQMGGFDTHAHQMRDQPGLMAQVAASADWFLNHLNTAGLLPSVTLFTASDFGRALLNNGDGSDHGWGGHHLVAGGGTLGGRIHGLFPTVALKTTTDVGSGRLLPTTSVTQLAGALGGWMGLSATELTTVLPNVGSFDGLGLMAG
ncbi:MAG: DUF1501 domain-containing protein [Rubrivivax sp.]|nr:DUF1501 domain-containing protein [Rubrivivax sp.]